MYSKTDMVVIAVGLVADEGGIDAGLVRVAARPVADDGEAVRGVEFLANINDGWWVGRAVTVTVDWLPTQDEDERMGNGEYPLERAFVADSLDPSQFTLESVENAEFEE